MMHAAYLPLGSGQDLLVLLWKYTRRMTVSCRVTVTVGMPVWVEILQVAAGTEEITFVQF